MESIEKTLKDLRHSVIYKHIIVDIETELIEKFLRIAFEMKMMSSYHHYMFTSLVCASSLYVGYISLYVGYITTICWLHLTICWLHHHYMLVTSSLYVGCIITMY